MTWGMSEFEEADIVDIFNESFDNPVEKNMDSLRNLVTMAEKAVKDDVAYQNMTQRDWFTAPDGEEDYLIVH